MPAVSTGTRYALTLCRLHVACMSNGTRLCDKLELMPTPEEIQQMDVRHRAFLVEPLMSQSLRDTLFNPSLSMEEKVRACREAIDRVTPVLEQLEGDSEYRECVILRLALHRPLSYLWAVCGDREKALHHATCMVELLERNLFYMAVPQIAQAVVVITSLLERLSAIDLRRRVEQLSLKGARYVIWMPHRSLELDVLRQMEALVEQVATEAASGEHFQEASPVHHDVVAPMLEGWEDELDVNPGFWDWLQNCGSVFELSR